MKKIAIIGAGPAGLLAAYKIKKENEEIIINIYDKGKPVSQRKCLESENKKCYGCNPCNKINGVAGAGLMSDGKLLFHPSVGNNLDEICGREKNLELIKNVKDFFVSQGVKIQEERAEEIKELGKKSSQNGIDFLYPCQAHVGSDKLVPIMQKIENELKEKDINFICNTDIKKIDELDYDFLLLAPGRGGGANGWLEKILKEKGYQYSYRPVDIGVRIEVQRVIADPITEISWDMKFYMTTDTYDDKVRTFCTCPGGYVGRETFGEFNLVNGHANSNPEKSSQNTNFAMLITIPLTKPLSNSNEFARSIAQLFYTLGNNKPLLQRFGDLKKGRRSKEENRYKYSLQPTLEDVTWGDIALAMPSRYIENLKEAIYKLDKVMPGLANEQTLLYAPEIKFHGLNIKTDENLHIGDNIYVAGDGAGVSRGIVGAAASGILVAEGILKNL